jgi:hypothetical protein
LQLFESIGDVDDADLKLDEYKRFNGVADVKFRRPGTLVSS